jgi:hypothetical protein
VKLHSVFLHKDCVLPDPLDPLCVPFGEQWTHVEEISSSVFDIMIRQAGWHFIWISGSCSRRGCAWTQAKAIENALGRALGAVSKQSNAAEFDSVRVTKCLGFHIATVTVQRRRIQELSLLEADVRDGSRALHADVREIR